MSTENKMNLGSRESQVIKVIVEPISNSVKDKVKNAISAVATAIKNKHL
jgi:hypothetical protein